MPARIGARRMEVAHTRLKGVVGLDLDFAAGRYALNGPYSSGFPAGWTLQRTDGPGSATALTPEGTRQRFASNVARRTGRGLLVERTTSNLIQSPGAPSTQSRTVTAVAHTLSFEGTGSITLSGASTAGPLVGTGASNRVSLTFTPSAGSLTMTVAGDVRDAQLEPLPIATSPVLDAVAATGVRGLETPYITGLDALFAQPFTVDGVVESVTGYSGVAVCPFSVANHNGTQNGGVASRITIYRDGNLFVAQTIMNGLFDGQGAAAMNGITGEARWALSYDGTTVRWAVNGIAGTDTVPRAAPAVPINRLDIGRASGDGNSPTNSFSRRLRVRAGALSTAAMQALTA